MRGIIVICTPDQTYCSDQISNKLDGACGMDGPKVKHNTRYNVELTGKVCSVDSGTDWMMVL
jgi:hypothetical protein